MSDVVVRAKRVIGPALRRYGPTDLIDATWAKYLEVKTRNRLTLAESLVFDPDELAALQRQHAPANREDDFLSFGWLRRRLAGVDDSALTSYFAVVAKDHVPALCAPADSYRALIDSVITVSVQSNLRFGYWIDGKVVSASSYAQLVRALEGRPAFQIHLQSVDDDAAIQRELVFFVERWDTIGKKLEAPRHNPITREIYLQSPSAKSFLETPGRALDELYPLPLMEECTFEIDVVYTWVNGNDPDWQELHAQYTNQDDASEGPASAIGTEASSLPDVPLDRYLNRDELKYSLRSLLTHAPWVRHVYILSNCKPPEWFDTSNDRVTWVDHEEFIDAEHLPTFSSHAIEASVHKVPGLTEHFLYFNDDIFLLKPANKTDFFLANGLAKIRPEAWGKVHGEVDSSDPDYINAARNVQTLLQEHFAKTPTKLHTHTPQSMKKSVVEACEATFPNAYEQTRSNRFRAITDISPTSNMYPNFAYLSGEAVIDYPLTALLNARHPYRETLNGYIDLMRSGKTTELPLTVCVNDGGGSAQDADWSAAIVRFMNTAFADPSEAEIAE